MADPIIEQRRAVETTIGRNVRGTANQQGWLPAEPGRNPADPFSGRSGNLAQLTDAATGVDPITGETLLGFTFDLSKLDGDDVLL